MIGLNLSKLIKRLGGRKLYAWYAGLTARERVLVAVASAGILAYGVYLPVEAFSEYLETNRRDIELRLRDLENISRYAGKYRELNTRLDKVKASLAKSQMTFEQVTKELDRVVKSTGIAEGSYQLKNPRAPEELGQEYETQQFSVPISSASLEQLVKLLYELQYGGSPFYIGKVDIFEGQKPGDFRATLEITTIGKKGVG